MGAGAHEHACGTRTAVLLSPFLEPTSFPGPPHALDSGTLIRYAARHSSDQHNASGTSVNQTASRNMAIAAGTKIDNMVSCGWGGAGAPGLVWQ